MAKTLARFNDRYAPLIVWVLRILVGTTFIFSGFVKEVDPWGFFYKISEYLSVWHADFVSREVVQFAALAISLVEFISGVFLLLGAMRRSVCVVLMTLMAVMLPLTAYIAVANPVADCGCFGDAWVLSNKATLLKNVALTLALIYLVRYNTRSRCLIRPMTQWMAMVACIVYCLIIGIAGYGYQPLIDFRQYQVGSRLIDDIGGDGGLRLVYERDGEQREFELDALPDSTWTYLRRVEAADDDKAAFAIYDGDEEVTDDVLADEGPQILLVVSEPLYHERARASMANNLNDYVRRRGGDMIGIVATDAAGLDKWSDMTRPDFDVYTADDTSLKELVRGVAGVVYLEDGVIKWKRNLYSLPGDFPDFDAADDELAEVYVIDDGRAIRFLTGALLLFLLFLVITSLRPFYKKSPLPEE